MKNVLIFSVVFFFSASAFAQNVQLSSTQETYNEQGVALAQQGKLGEALAKFEASLVIGEANVIYMNIGRTLAKMGECKRAKESYAKARTAPTVAAPTAEEVAGFLTKFEGELPDVCPARIELSCKPEGVKATINGEVVQCGETHDYPPGAFTIVGEIDPERVEKKIELAAGEKQAVELDVPVEVIVDKPQPIEDPGMSGLKVTGLVLGGVGVAALATALIIDLAVIGPKIDDFEALENANDEEINEDRDEIEGLQGINTAILIGGGVLTAAGVVLFLLPTNSDDSAQVGFSIDEGRPTVGLRGTF